MKLINFIRIFLVNFFDPNPEYKDLTDHNLDGLKKQIDSIYILVYFLLLICTLTLVITIIKIIKDKSRNDK